MSNAPRSSARVPWSIRGPPRNTSSVGSPAVTVPRVRDTVPTSTLTIRSGTARSGRDTWGRVDRRSILAIWNDEENRLCKGRGLRVFADPHCEPEASNANQATEFRRYLWTLFEEQHAFRRRALDLVGNVYSPAHWAHFFRMATTALSPSSRGAARRPGAGRRRRCLPPERADSPSPAHRARRRRAE